MPGVALVACEPIPAIAALWLGNAAAIFQNPWALALLAAVVLLKCGLFGALARIGFWRGFRLMFVANIVTTILGIFVGIFESSSAFLIPALIVVAIICVVVSGYVAPLLPLLGSQRGWPPMTRVRLGTIMFCLSLLSGYALAYIALSGIEGRLYFTIKVLGFFLGFLFSLALTTIVEAVIVARLNDDEGVTPRLLKAALLANLWTFFAFFFIMAIYALPIRLRGGERLYPNFFR